MNISEDNINFLLIVAAFILNAIVKKLRALWNRSKLFSSSKINQDLKTQIEINAKLDVLRNQISASRVSIVNYNPKDATATMLYERVKDGTSALIQVFKGIQTSSIAPLLYELEENGRATMHQDYYDKKVVELHRSWGIISTYKYKLDKNKSIAYGCLVIAFDSDKSLDEQEQNIINNSLITISHLYHSN